MNCFPFSFPMMILLIYLGLIIIRGDPAVGLMRGGGGTGLRELGLISHLFDLFFNYLWEQQENKIIRDKAFKEEIYWL
jgi:hypothetical protein